MLQPLLRSSAITTARCATRSLATAASNGKFVKIVEVSPRDGLQNEKTIVPTETKVELIRRLADTGVPVIEADRSCRPSGVPMGDTPQVVTQMPVHASISYPVLVPNMRGLEGLQKLLANYADGSKESRLG